MENTSFVTPPANEAPANEVHVSEKPKKNRLKVVSRFLIGLSLFLFVLFVFLAGVISGVRIPFLKPYFERGYRALFSDTDYSALNREKEKTQVVAEDDVIMDLIEKNTAGVVSIAVSKNMATSQNFFGGQWSPFFEIGRAHV